MADQVLPDGAAWLVLSGGSRTLVDADLLPTLEAISWHANQQGYVMGWSKDRRRPILLHRVVNGTPEGMATDHINHDKLDNRRCNLRTCTPRQNSYNKAPTGRSQHKGVTRGAGVYRAYWAAKVRVNGKMLHLGYFKFESQAANAYESAVRDLHGDFAYKNVPPLDTNR